MDALLLAVFNELVALENGVALDLVDGGDDAGGVDDGLELRGISHVSIQRYMKRLT